MKKCRTFCQKLAKSVAGSQRNYLQNQNNVCWPQKSAVAKLQNVYNEAKMATSKMPLPTQVRSREVFANNELHLNEIGVYGFDYDYTIAVYRREIHNLIYSKAIRRLVEDYKYPSALIDEPYDDNFAVRGLHYDVREGTLMKLDAYCQIQEDTVYRGRTKLSQSEVDKLYARHSVPSHFLKPGRNQEQPRLVQLLDLFSLPEIGLLSTVVEYFQSSNSDYDTVALFHDVQEAVKSVHVTGEMYSAICNDPPRFIHDNPGLRLFLERLVNAGKIVFLVTNSPFGFMDSGMRFLIGDDWEKFFHFIVVQAKKPRFFQEQDKPFRRFCTDTDRMTYEKVAKFISGNVYCGGNMEEFVNMAGIANKGVLYFGDHINTDLKDPMMHLRWSTGAIVPELGREINTQNSSEFRTQIRWLMELQMLIHQHQDQARQFPDSRELLNQWLNERDKYRAQIKSMFNSQFGSIFRTYHNSSFFCYSMMRMADIYTSRLPNLLQYGLDHNFFPRRSPLPHEASFCLPEDCKLIF